MTKNRVSYIGRTIPNVIKLDESFKSQLCLWSHISQRECSGELDLPRVFGNFECIPF